MTDSTECISINGSPLEQEACAISFSEKVRIFSHDYLKCCEYIENSDVPRHYFTKKLYAELISTSQLLEDFLDFHGAKNSKDWFFYRELCAAVRHIGSASYSQKHILNRLAFYHLSDTEEFEREGEEILDFLTQALMKMAPMILHEAERLNIGLPKDRFTADDFPAVTTSEMLPYDIDDLDKGRQKENIVCIANEFLNIARSFDQLGFYEPYEIGEIKTIIPDKVNEVKMRSFEMMVHNLQSQFDTYVIHGGYLFGNRKMKQLRGHFSVVFHLLQVIGRLLHFYERHLHDAGYKNIYKQVQDRLAELIDPERLLDRTINFGLYYVCHFLTTGKELAREILNENIEKGSITVGIPQKLGFHSRPSLLVAKIVQHFGGQVELCIENDRFDASSVLDIQWAGGKIQKENRTNVTFQGDLRALRDIEILSSVNYGEDSIGKGIDLPNELSYLK